MKCVIFDLDGTLLYTLEDLWISVNFALDKLGYNKRALDEVRNFVGNGVQKLIERAIPNGLENKDYAECLKLFKNHYAQNMYNKTAPYPGIKEMLEELKLKGIKTAVVSNKFDLAVKELCSKYFGNLIEIAIGESENVRKKPAPDSVLRAIKELNSKKEFCIYSGDSDVDVQTARNTGIDCIGVTWGFRDRALLEQEGAKYIINKPFELIETINKINSCN